MGLRFLSLFALATTVGCGATPRPPSSPPSNTPVAVVDARPKLAGDYSAPHSVMMVCEGGDDGWCEEDVADSMTVHEAGDDLEVAIDLVQTNGHTCTFEGHLAHDPDPTAHRWTFHADDDTDEGPCTLTLEQADTELRLASDGCRYYCGARASLDATFPITSR
jgi:hypothetical protein